MKTIERCECEAVHRVEDTADCKVCGHELNAWRGNKVLSFDLIKNPIE